MNAYDVFIDPSVISDTLSCNFINAKTKHLIVGKATILEIYEVIKVHQPSPSHVSDYKLKLTDSYKLQGLIKGLKAVRTVENTDLDYVLVLTKTAKVSCIKWDAAKHSIATVSLHYYDNALQNIAYESFHETELLVGSVSRPLMCLRRNNSLVFLPFNGHDDDEEEGHVEHESKTNFMKHDERYSATSITHIHCINAISHKSNTAKGDRPAYESPDPFIAASSEIPLRSFVPDLFQISSIKDANFFDDEIGEIVDLQFLHNYRVTTVGVISQVRKTWAGLLSQDIDNVIYSVWSLDTANYSSTTIFQIQNLPFDIHRVIPLKYPLNGSILLGCNELVHVDSGGNARRVAVNSFVFDSTRSMKDFVDLSHIELTLEDCVLSAIPNKEMVLMILKNGDMYIIHFDIEGKTIKGLSMDKLDPQWYKNIEIENPGSIVVISENLLFISGKSSDSFLIEIGFSETCQTNELDTVLRTHDPPQHSTFVIDDDDEEGLYDDDKTEKFACRDAQLYFVKHDTLRCNGPISSFTVGKYSPEKFMANLPNPSHNELSIIAASGVGKSSCLNVMSPTVQPIVRSSLRFSRIHRLWILSNKYLVTSDESNLKSEIFDINKQYARIPSKHFLHTDLTIAMHELGNGRFILQVTPRRVFLFDQKLKPVVSLDDELTEFGDASIINSVFSDDFLMMFFSSGEVVLYCVNTYNKVFTRVDLPKLLSDTIITTGYITHSRLLNIVSKDISVLTNKGQKRKRGHERISIENSSGDIGPRSKTFVLVTGDNRIVAFNRFHNEKCFQLNSVNKFTNHLTLGFFDINGTDPDPFIKQVVLNDLGDEFLKDEYLTILTVGGEIHTYKMYFDGENYCFVKEVNITITGAPYNAYPYGTSLERRLIYFPNISGLTCLMVTGVVPYLITRSRHSLIRIHKFSKIPIISFVPYSDATIKNGLIFLDTKKNARIAELSREFNYENNWPIRRIPIGATIKGVAYHESSHTYIVSTFNDIPYKCLDEDGNPIVGSKPDKPPAQSYKGRIHLISPLSWTSIDSFPLDDNEVGLQLKSVPLDIGSETKRFKRKKEFLLIGTGKYRVEDLACNGSYRLLEIIDIIPEPGRPETNHKFKEVTHEDTRGAVTALCDVSGRFLIAQGQKVIVRDIIDTTAVSVAFMDLSVYVSEAKSFGNLILFGDTLKGMSLAGFDAEPFRMVPLAKDSSGNDINCADFIYHNKEIFILSADRDKAVHVFHYNPEDPASSNGQRLLKKSSFNTNFQATCMKTIPKHEQMLKRPQTASESFQIITSTAEGAMYTVFPVDEAAFKRMYILEQQLIDKEHHHCGLNPRSNRVSQSESTADNTQWPILDTEILKRFAKLNKDRALVLGQKMSLKSAAVDIWGDLINFENVMGRL